MNVNDIAWHVDNFVNTWNGWYHFLNGAIEFFQRLVPSIEAAKGAADGEGAQAFFTGLSSNTGTGLGLDNWPL